MLLKDRVAVVYGGGGAIGGAVARAFSREGATLFLAGRTRERVEAVVNDIASAGGVAHAAPVDAYDEDGVERHIDDVVRTAGRIDVLFNAIRMEDVQRRAPD